MSRAEPGSVGPLYAAGLSATGYSLPAGLSFDEWAAMGPPLVQMAQSAMWWVGDWLRYGEHEFGEKYAQAVEATGLSVSTLKNAQWVADRIPAAERRADVPFSHHRAVASLDRKPRRALLERAATEHLREHEIRTCVREMKAEAAAGGPLPPPEPERTLAAALRDALARLDQAIDVHDWRLAAEARQFVAEAETLARVPVPA